MIQEIHAGRRYGVTGTAKSGSLAETEKPAEASEKKQSTKVDTVQIGIKKETSVTYSKTVNKKLNESEIAALKEEAEKATENLRRLVEELILKQNKNYKASVNDSSEASGIATGSVEAAQQAISEGGEFGVKAVSDRLVDFAVSISGGDKSKFSELVSAIDQGFAAAKKALGGELPDICQQTYDETMRKLNEWADSDE